MKTSAEEQVSRKVKIASYVITLLIAALSGYVGAAFTNGGAIGIIVFILTFLFLSSVSDVRSNLQIYLTEIPVLFRDAIRYIRTSNAGQIVNHLSLWSIALFKPLTLRKMYLTRREEKDPKRARRLLIRLLLLPLISCILSLIIQTFRVSGSKYGLLSWLSIIILPVFVLVLLPGGLSISQNKPKFFSLFPTSGKLWMSTTLFYFILLFIYILLGALLGLSFYTADGVVILLSLLVGTLFGLYYGADTNIYSRASKLPFIFFQLIIGSFFFLLTMFLVVVSTPEASLASPDRQRAQLTLLHDPMIESLGLIINGWYVALINPIPPYQNIFVMMIFQAIAGSILGLIGSLLGIGIGISGLLLLIEAPFFYYAAYRILINNDVSSLSKLKQVIQFDQWRRWNFLGEKEIYREIYQYYPDQVKEILIPQLFFTARHKFALNQMAKYLNDCETQRAVELLLPLLPYVECERLGSNPVVDIEFLTAHTDDDLFGEIKDRRVFFFSHLMAKAESLTYETRIISAFEDLIELNNHGTVINEQMRQNFAVAFGANQNVPHVLNILPFIKLVNNSLIVSSCEDISVLFRAWSDFHKNIEHDPIFSHLRPITMRLANFASVISKINLEEVQSAAALQIFFMRIQFDEMSEELSFGVIPMKHIALHWEKLFLERLRPLQLEARALLNAVSAQPPNPSGLPESE